MAGFFSKKQYAAIAESELAMKLLKERCLECSIWAMFFNSYQTVAGAKNLPQALSALDDGSYIFPQAPSSLTTTLENFRKYFRHPTTVLIFFREGCRRWRQGEK